MTLGRDVSSSSSSPLLSKELELLVFLFYSIIEFSPWNLGTDQNCMCWVCICDLCCFYHPKKYHEGEGKCASVTVESSIVDADAAIFLMTAAAVVMTVKCG